MSENYVRIYENVFSDELCDRLVAKFEENKDNHQRVTAHKLGFTQLNFREAGWEEEQNEVCPNLCRTSKEVRKRCRCYFRVGPNEICVGRYSIEEVFSKRFRRVW